MLKKISLGLVAIISSIITAIPVKAAERIFFFYGPLEFSLSVNSLVTFAETGIINRDLRLYLRGANQEQLNKFREALRLTYPLSSVQVYQFFNTAIGEDILTRIGDSINIPGRINGKFALRAALIKASQDPQGVTILNVLRHFPMDIELNVNAILRKSDNLERLINATNILVAEIGNLSNQRAAKIEPVNFAALVDPRKRGEFGYSQEVLNLTDASRQRRLRVIVYKPQRWPEGKSPIIVISHGLASSPEDFDKFGQQLASYGFVVAIPQHPGSDFAQFQAVLQGRSGEVFLLDEFIDRPLDVKTVLDELDRRNLSEFEGRLDLNTVGVAGHSFGGYTGLALAGAQIDFDRLTRDCDPAFRLPNTSLLLQCRALKLPNKTYNFLDPRVKAVFALNPVNSSLFGPQRLSEVKVPVFLFAGSEDFVTPTVLEQLRSFVWLTTPNKYLAVVRGDIHVDISQLDAGTVAMMESVSGWQFADPSLIDSYTFSMMVSFFEVYLRGDDSYRVFLQPNYSKYISFENFELYLINYNVSEQLKELMLKFKRSE